MRPSVASRLPPLPPLPLLLLLAAGCACGTAVHEVAISVRSVRSVTYLGTQVSIFQHVSMPLRYFFQPLSFFDADSVRTWNDEELKLARLHFDVYMWTEEFVELVRSHFPAAESVELMPLTQIRLTWSQEAALWLGDGFNDTWRLLDEWKDADKPQMRTTFTVACAGVASCERLQRLLNGSSELAESLFDLRYRVPFGNSRNVTLTVGNSHFRQSPTFRQLQLFASSKSGMRRLLLTDETVDELADEAFTAAVSQLQQELRQRVESVEAAARQSAMSRLHRRLRADVVESPTARQWSSEVFWPPARRSLRPDRLSAMLNQLLAPAAKPLTVRLSNSSDDVLLAVADSFPRREAAAVASFARLHSPRRRRQAPPPIDVADVRELALALGSCVSWHPASAEFRPAPTATLFRLDLGDFADGRLLLMQAATVRVQTTEHSDRLLQLRPPTDAEFSPSPNLRAQLDIAQQRLQRLQQNFTSLAAAVGVNRQRLTAWIDALAPPPHAAAAGNVQRRSGEASILRRRVDELSDAVRRIAAGGSWQPKFGDSFCLLANSGDPPGMACRDLGFFMPYKSLRWSPVFDRRIRTQTGSVGENSFTRVDEKFFKFRLRVCCN